jgi:RNA polymerase sigma-70 factor (ECF subfamily)
VLSLEFDTAEGRYSLEPPDTRTPDALFDRQWAMTVLDLGLRRLAHESAAEGRGLEFELLRPSLLGESAKGGYDAIARGLGSTEGAVKVAVHRLRRRFRELVREEIAQTVATESEIDEEVKYLLAALRR